MLPRGPRIFVTAPSSSRKRLRFFNETLPSSFLPSTRRRQRSSPAIILLLRRLARRNLWHARANPLIVNRHDLEEAPLPCVGKRRTLVLPHIVANDLVRTSCAACEISVDDLSPAELHGADLVGALHIRLMRPLVAVDGEQLNLLAERAQHVNGHRISDMCLQQRSRGCIPGFCAAD